MKGIRPVGISLLTALALMLAVLPASGASAAAKVLQLKVGGVPVANGSVGDTGLVLDECVSFAKGTIVANGEKKVKLTATENAFTECPPGKTESGTITTTEMGANGKVKLTGLISIAEPGPCVYVFKKFKTTFHIPGFAEFAPSTTVGKLNKELSSKECAKTNVQSWFGDAAPEEFGEPFETSN